MACHTKENNVKKPSVKAKSVRRGRPLGSKNKPKSLEQKIKDWEPTPRKPQVNFRELAQKLQNELAKSYVEVQELEKELEAARLLIKLKDMRIETCEKMIVKAVQRKWANEDEDFAVWSY